MSTPPTDESPAPAFPGPATLAGVQAWLPTAEGDRAALQLAVDAVNDVVRDWLEPIAVDEAGVERWRPRHVQGADMLVARVWRRRHSAGGVEAFSGEGVAYVARTDPDVALLLQMGAYAPPAVG